MSLNPGLGPEGRGRQRRGDPGIALLALLCLSDYAQAYDFTFDALGLSGKLQSQLSIGATLRTESRSGALVGKLNLPGQQQFCEDKPAAPPGAAPGSNCTTVAGNLAYLRLPGVANANADNGNLNYDKGDLASAAIRYAPRLQISHEQFGIDISGVGFYDPINYNFNEYHPNNLQDNNGFQPRNTRRSGLARRQVGRDLHLLDAYLSTSLPLPGDRQLSVKLGNQILSLGTTSTLVFNGLNTINPPDANLRFLPGADTRDFFQRVPMAVLGTSLTDAFSLQGFYQFMWKPIVTPPIGSYYSVSDVVGAGRPYVALLNGKNREDPNNLMGVQERTQGNANQISNAGRTLFFEPDRPARDGGEYGIVFNYLATQLNNTSFDFAYLNLHSRFPLIGFIASAESCANRANNQAEAVASCMGFTAVPGGKEPLPLDSVRLFQEYPRDIHSFGFSFSTNLGDVAWTGELVYRPNQPLQVDAIDLGFAALQPTFPAHTISLGVVNDPGERVATPDYVQTIYRRQAVQPLQDIRGYERFRTLAYNTSFLLLSGASANPFGADQVTTLLEIGAYQILNLPSLELLQIAAPGTVFHHSAGVDGSGTANAEQAVITPPNTTPTFQDRLNPSYQASGFATSFSYGYRLLTQIAYENVLPGTRVAPQFTFFQDIAGRSPQPIGEFIAGRKQASAGLNVVYNNSLAATLRYNWSFGGGYANAFSDRDNLQLSMSYDF